ncbi:MAG: 3-hydroxyacyl-ACP dehydratase FabZ family protein [Candidatus Binatia bacterium]
MKFRFIDRLISFEGGERPRLVTAKAFPRSDEYTDGHPQRPGEIPTCLVLEALTTSGVRLVYSRTGERVVGVLLRVDEAKILSPVFPGEEIVVQTELLGLQPEAQKSVGLARTEGYAFVGDRVVAEARLVLLCFPRDGFEASLPW